MARARRWVYFFGNGKAEGKVADKEVLGGKGAGLAEMTNIGLPVPAGFTIATECCDLYYKAGRRWPAGLDKQVRYNLRRLERACKKRFGSGDDPLLVSVRSGAAVSMPGMMETILNLGLNDESVEALAARSGNRRFALDAYRRLIMMYGSTAKGIERAVFDEAFDRTKEQRTRPRLGVGTPQRVQDTDVNEVELEELLGDFKLIYSDHVGEPFPQEPYQQLVGAVNAVFGSWMADRAVTYRRVERISGLKGTAINVCQMVFGNMGQDSGTGVCFTRDPSTGENVYFGDLLMNAQGEDVVAGVRTPERLAELARIMPEAYQRLEAVRAMLEVHYADMQDLEFTIERGTLYLLQCRTGKRSPAATFKIAVDQATGGVISAARAKMLARKKFLPARYVKAATRPVITRDQAVARIKPEDVQRLFYPVIDPGIERGELERRRLGEGIGAVPGAACGKIVFSSEQAEQRAADDEKVILVCQETSPEDVGGMHAAVVARGWGKCCIVGCDQLGIDAHARSMSVNGRTFHEGDFLTLDGGTGEMFDGRLSLVRPEAPPEYDTLMGWCDRRRRLKVRANADTPEDAAKAVKFGAEGIGLCRTEHMFFDPREPERLRAMRQMILADNTQQRKWALDRLLPFQQGDFEGIFEAMDGKPVTIRLLDPPLHEFLPSHTNPRAQQEVADDINAPIREELDKLEAGDDQRRQRLEAQLVTVEDINRRVDQLHEANPMLGHRGCRLCITFPEMLEMQVRAIMAAAVACARRGVKVRPEIMIPLTIDAKELDILVQRVHAVARELLASSQASRRLPYTVGTMIETPRAALTADRLAESAEFFSFGTNDLTQTTMALSRDDAGRFLPEYVDQSRAAIFKADPFESLDLEGVGQLVRMGLEKGRSTRPKLKVGICGEHGGELNSVKFCHTVGMDYVSCSPYRVPIARLAAAQAAIEESAKKSPARRRVARKSSPARRPAVSKRAAPKKRAPKRKPAKAKAGAKTKTKARKKTRS